MKSGYRLRAAERGDLVAIPAIERRAAELFRDQGLPESFFEETFELGDLTEAMEDGRLFVAVDSDDRPVGFALAEDLGGCAHLEEIDVDPEHGRQGIGAALVDEVCGWARDQGYEHVTLTTFGDVPWNAPFYAGLGFHERVSAELSAELRERCEEEARRGLDPARRVVMHRRIRGPRGNLRIFAAVWLGAVVAVSAMASTTSGVAYLQWVAALPGRDKTAHFLLMGGLAYVAVRAFSRMRLAGRRLGTAGVLAAVVGFVLAEELLQLYLPLRAFSLHDLAYSLAGVASFGALAVWRDRRR